MTGRLANAAQPAPDARRAAFPIALEPRQRLALPHELALARLAVAAAPGSLAAKRRLARLLIEDDRFAEAVDVFDEGALEGFADAMMITRALLSLETPAANARAAELAGQARALAGDADAEAAALAAEGKARLRLGDAEGVALLHAALRRDPHNPDACRRLVTHLLAHAPPAAALALLDDLADQGVEHARLFAARMLALARAGDTAGARACVGLDRFLHRAMLAPPTGWPSLAAFNAALATQLLAHPALRFERFGTASEQSWRVDVPLSNAAPLVETALMQIRDAVAGYVATLRDDHPWVRARPAGATMRSWSVITDGNGFETWHAHQNGWMSGVYYVAVPEMIRCGSDEAGCIAWGLPPDMVGATAASSFGLRHVRPEPGMLLLFPSHAYHRTFPYRSVDTLNPRRIVLAFDLGPD